MIFFCTSFQEALVESSSYMVRMFIRWCFLPGALRHFSFPQFGGGVQGEATGQSESLTYTVSLAEQ